jgi:hypothetical protein
LSSVTCPIVETLGPKGLLQGGGFVTARAREMVTGKFNCYSFVPPLAQLRPEKLKGSKFDTSEDIAAFVQKFDEGLKRVFSDDKGVHYVKFGSPRDNDPGFGIQKGKLTLTG